MTGCERDQYAARDVFDGAPVGVTIHDPSEPDSPVVYANDRFLELTGYDREGLLGTPATQLSVGASADGLLGDADASPVTVRTPSADGSTFRNRLWATTLPDGDTALVHHAVTAGDRRATIDALDRYAETVHSTETVRDICQATARAGAELFAVDYSVVAVREGEWLVPRGADGDVPPDLTRALHLESGAVGGAYRDGEARLLSDAAPLDSSSGLVTPVDEHGVLLVASSSPDAFDAADLSLAGLLATHAETAFDRLERDLELEQRTERLSDFADVVSHDLRNPLAVLDGAITLARETGDEAHFERAQRTVDRMDGLVGSLREQARLGADAGTLETVDLVDASEASWRAVPSDGVELSVQTDQRIRADPDRLGQLLENLFRNAIEHGDAWHVTLGELPSDTGFYVRDDGSGIPESERHSVFESGYTTAENGTGFGLSICQQVAQFHGWELTVTESSNGGARFEITGVERVRS